MKQYNLREILYNHVLEGNLKDVELLLDHYPHLLSEHKNKFNLMNVVLQNNDVKLMNLLANYNIDPNIKYKGLSPLHIAIQRGSDIQIIRSLLLLSAEPDILDKHGNTPLHFAAKLGNSAAVKELIKAGANINYMNNAYITPLELAQKYKRLKVKCLLIRAGAKKKKSFIETLKISYNTANIYRKIIILTITVVLLTINTTASLLTYGLLFPTVIISMLASLGISIVCLVKPFFRVKVLEKKIMNKQIHHNELQELFSQPSSTEQSNIPATNLLPEAIKDNFFQKESLEKEIQTSIIK